VHDAGLLAAAAASPIPLCMLKVILLSEDVISGLFIDEEWGFKP
jgi:hypothetical protein